VFVASTKVWDSNRECGSVMSRAAQCNLLPLLARSPPAVRNS